MKYDDASWHYGGEFPANSPEDYGGTHIALFLKWCFIQGWAGQLHLEEEPEDVQRVIDGQLSATEFFFKYCDGKLTNEDFNEDGNAFATAYYGDEGLYMADYEREFGNLIYIASESEHDFETFSAMIEDRKRNGPLTASQKKASKPWWRLW